MILSDFFHSGCCRRQFLRVSLGGTLGVWLSSLLDADAESETGPASSSRSAILLWMNGGPSQIDTFDPKPGHPNGGAFKAIPTSVDGLKVCEHLPQVAAQMHRVGLIRSMTSTEGSHDRGRYLLHTGYRPVGTSEHPAFGSVISAELGPEKSELPNFVSINLPSVGAGLLGMRHAAFHVPKPQEGVPNVVMPEDVNADRMNQRLDMLRSLDRSFVASKRGDDAKAHLEIYEKTVRLMRSPGLKAFDLDQEKEAARDAYGRNEFGQGCLMARRLIERGVRAVEVSLNGWDTHLNNFKTNAELLAVLDPALSALLKDLAARGLLERTLVVWMGEFGRTPRINALGGRDHWPKAWTVALAGASIRGGAVIGKTREDGAEVAERPVTVPDLFATFCKALSIDAAKTNYTSNGRPITIVDKGKPVEELF